MIPARALGGLCLVAMPLALLVWRAPAAVSLTRDEQVEQAVAYMRLKVPNAERAFGPVIAAEPYHRRANFAAGMAAVDAGRMDEAERYFKTVLEKNPDDQEVNLSLAAVYHNAGRLDEARVLYAKLRALHPEDSRVVYNLGLMALKQGNEREALSQFETYLKMPSGMNKRRAVAATVAELRTRLKLPVPAAAGTAPTGVQR